MQQRGAAHTAVNHWNDEYSKCLLLSHTAVPSFIAGPCSRGPLKRTQLNSNKKEKLKIKEVGGWIAAREEKDKGSQTLFFFYHVMFQNYTKYSNISIFFFLLWLKRDGGEPHTGFWRFIKSNEQCHIPFPSSVTFGSNGLGLISTIWLQLQWPVEWWGVWN